MRRRLLVLRHAKSSWDDESLPDHDRPLNRRGERDAPRMGRLLREERLLPELSGRRVLRRTDGALDDTVPAARSITLRDLLTFRMGFGLDVSPGETPLTRAIEEQKLAMGPPKPQTPHKPDEWLKRFAALPLMHQPGERWMYNAGSLVLGVLIAVGALSLTVTAYQQPAAGGGQPTRTVEVEKLKDNFYVLRGGGGNTSVLVMANGVAVEATTLRRLSGRERGALARAARDYGRFRGLRASLKIQSPPADV